MQKTWQQKLSDRNPQGLLELFNLQIGCRVWEKLGEMFFAQVIYSNGKFRDLQCLFVSKGPDKPRRVSSPQFTGWDSPSRGNNWSSLEDRVGLHQWTFHENGMLPNDALRLNCAGPQETVCANRHKPFDGCLRRQTWKVERSKLLTKSQKTSAKLGVRSETKS